VVAGAGGGVCGERCRNEGLLEWVGEVKPEIRRP